VLDPARLTEWYGVCIFVDIFWKQKDADIEGVLLLSYLQFALK